MPQMRTSIKIRADYRPANRQDGHKRCQYCSRKEQGWKGRENHAVPCLNCKLLGITINPDCTCREYKPQEI